MPWFVIVVVVVATNDTTYEFFIMCFVDNEKMKILEKMVKNVVVELIDDVVTYCPHVGSVNLALLETLGELLKLVDDDMLVSCMKQLPQPIGELSTFFVCLFAIAAPHRHTTLIDKQCEDFCNLLTPTNCKTINDYIDQIQKICNSINTTPNLQIKQITK
jgi:hypothetical protein